jgi:predicted CoA-binding protein
MKDAVNDFLAQEHIAVTGVSGSGETAANAIYRRLKGTGHLVYGVNPNLETFNGNPCYPDLASIPTQLDFIFHRWTPERNLIVHRKLFYP